MYINQGTAETYNYPGLKLSVLQPLLLLFCFWYCVNNVLYTMPILQVGMKKFLNSVKDLYRPKLSSNLR